MGYKEEYGLKNLILTGCVCHSGLLAVSHASNDTIPCQVEYLVQDGFQCLRPTMPYVNLKEKPLHMCATLVTELEVLHI